MRFFISIASVFLIGLASGGPVFAGPYDPCGGGGILDEDSDTVPWCLDNCMLVPNEAVGQPAGALAIQCDTDQDGYGNACDCDTNNDGVCGTPDFGEITAGIVNGLPGHPVNDADTNCDGVIGTPDFGLVTNAIVTGGPSPVPGPSGLSCAGTIPCP